MTEVFASIREYYREHHPSIEMSLRPGADEETILALENGIGFELPVEFKELYRLADGQEEVNHPFFPDGYDFMPIEFILSTWKMHNQINDESDPPTRLPVGPVRDDWWQSEWIPFASMISGDFLCIDLAPGPGGSTGQVIEFIHDSPSRDRLSVNLTDFLGDLDEGLRNGSYRMDPKIGIIVSR